MQASQIDFDVYQNNFYTLDLSHSLFSQIPLGIVYVVSIIIIFIITIIIIWSNTGPRIDCFSLCRRRTTTFGFARHLLDGMYYGIIGR